MCLPNGALTVLHCTSVLAAHRQYLCSGSRDTCLRLWDTGTQQCVRQQAILYVHTYIYNLCVQCRLLEWHSGTVVLKCVRFSAFVCGVVPMFPLTCLLQDSMQFFSGRCVSVGDWWEWQVYPQETVLMFYTLQEQQTAASGVAVDPCRSTI